MKEYTKKIVNRLNAPEAWPGIKSIERSNDLLAVASDSMGRGTVDGYLAGVLVLHQLAEEILALLIDDAEFFIQLKLYPYPFEIKRPKRMMFGKVIDQTESTVWFQNKRYIVDSAKELNQIRIAIVHGLTKDFSAQTVAEQARRVQDLYSKIHFMGLEAHYYFRDVFMEYFADSNWPPKDAVLLKDDGEIAS